ncbi:type IX secretion system periplasmic lipoprotein PorW/SprE [Pedobacter sp. PWIIR3]
MLSCSSQKDTVTSRGMQNLTSRYNYIYNANVALKNHRLELTDTYKDNYDQILPVYIAPEVDENQLVTSLNIKGMDEIIKKAQVIILEKSFSNYTDDAYILLGKANFYNGNYFTAAEYFGYAAKAYKTNIYSYIEALDWQARSLMQINRISSANTVLDSLEAALPRIKPSSIFADPFATMAQMSIYNGNDDAAISYLKDAIKASNSKMDKIRWNYILAQQYEKQKNITESILQYKKVEKSNAPFEMYFNAKLNQIKLTSANTKTVDKKTQLLSLLKDDKNLDYNDQVYFQIAEYLSSEGAYQEAQSNYITSIRVATSNQYQKGLSYLRVADLNFRYLKDYLKAKSYYDSAVAILPKNYPGYNLILKKSLNLDYLTQRYQSITLEDTLSAIAKLPIQDRLSRIQNFVNPANTKPINNNGKPLDYNYQTSINKGTVVTGSFYFSNPTALSMGFSDFKKKWGSRKLENNWRQSTRSAAQATVQDITSNTSTVLVPGDSLKNNLVDKQSLVELYSSMLPLTPELVKSANQKIIDAYYEIASFYLQELNDPDEAQQVYLTLLNRFPVNSHLDAIYYSLYLINRTDNVKVSDEYKNKVLTEFPNSLYTKTITDPSFSIRQSETEVAITKKYNTVFDQYLKKEFDNVITGVTGSESTQNGFLAAQFAYLKAIAIGRSFPVDSLITAFNQILVSYPDDQLITPLVKEHLNYINLHLEDFRKRKIALVDFDPNEPPFTGPNFPQPVVGNIPKPATTSEPQNKPELPKVISAVLPAQKPAVSDSNPIKTDGTFSNAPSLTYYFVVDVADASLTLSSSRFGIGQFNRGNYTGSNLRHQLKEFDNDQLIYVGNFSSFEEAKVYSNGIVPQLKQIMKVPAGIYTSFIISKENLDKLNSKALLEKYLEFYKNNY